MSEKTHLIRTTLTVPHGTSRAAIEQWLANVPHYASIHVETSSARPLVYSLVAFWNIKVETPDA